MRPLVLFIFLLCFLHVLICVASHVHTYLCTHGNACSPLLLSRTEKMELQQLCLNNLSPNPHVETSVEGMLYPTLPARTISVQQVQCIRPTTSAKLLHSGSATHLAIAHTQCICTWIAATAPYACKISFVVLICSQNLSTFTHIHTVWHTWCFWNHIDPGHFLKAMLIHVQSLQTKCYQA